MTTYSNPRMTAVIHDWPSGSKRVTATFAIEVDPKRGERATRTTNGAAKKLTYARKSRIVDGDDGLTYIANLTMYGHVSVMQGNMQLGKESIHPGEDGYAAALALFEPSPPIDPTTGRPANYRTVDGHWVTIADD